MYLSLLQPAAILIPLRTTAATLSGSGTHALLHYAPNTQSLMLIDQGKFSDAQGKVSPAVIGRCQSSCNTWHGRILAVVFYSITQVQCNCMLRGDRSELLIRRSA
jgi:hypothetical protein